MDEMTAFDQQIAREVLREAGPSEPVDGASILNDITAASRSPRRGFTMFSALKFVVAGVIVALFGGFLLAGVLTTQPRALVFPAAVTESPSPMTSEQLLSGMVTEEVEPGVYKVLNDGVRDLTSGPKGGVVAGHDGSVWLVGHEQSAWDSFVRLGHDESYEEPERTEIRGFTVTQDGTVWIYHFPIDLQDSGEAARLATLGDGSWIEQYRGLEAEALTIAPDGTLWTTTPAASEGLVVTRLGAEGWEPFEAPAPAEEGLLVSPSGEVWVAGASILGLDGYDEEVWQEKEQGRMWRYRWVDDDGAWQGQEVTVDAAVFGPFNHEIEVGADGTVWFAGIEPLMAEGEPVVDAEGKLAPGDSLLMRLDGTGWQRWGPADGVPPFEVGGGVRLSQALEGELWIEAQDHLARFDGSTWQRFLSGRDIGEWDIAPDGSVWVSVWLRELNENLSENDLYVITPEAVAGTE